MAKRLSTRLSKLQEQHLSPVDALILQALVSSAEIISAAIRKGYLTESLERTRKPIIKNTRSGIPGFQGRVIQRESDILEEVEFWRSRRPVKLANDMGLPSVDDSGELLAAFVAVSL